MSEFQFKLQVALQKEAMLCFAELFLQSCTWNVSHRAVTVMGEVEHFTLSVNRKLMSSSFSSWAARRTIGNVPDPGVLWNLLLFREPQFSLVCRFIQA